MLRYATDNKFKTLQCHNGLG